MTASSARMFFLLALLPASATAHGMLNYPPSRNLGSMIEAGRCLGDLHELEVNGTIPEQGNQGSCLWFHQGCQPGCSVCTGEDCTGSKCCPEASDPTLPESMRTFKSGYFDFFKWNPWRAPGAAPMLDPCGVAGGFDFEGAEGNGGYPPEGIPQGFAGSQMPELDGVETVWMAGKSVEVSWDLLANHGGGYQYRLCPKIDGVALTEACFQRLPLAFATNRSYIQKGVDESERYEIPALTTTTGTTPAGSEWRRNPIPACNGLEGGSLHTGCLGAPQFDPPLQDVYPASEWKPQAGLYGFGLGSCESGVEGNDCGEDEYLYWFETFNFNIIDEVLVPWDIASGDYMLQWRWDSEQTPQIWSGCADVTIVDGDGEPPEEPEEPEEPEQPGVPSTCPNVSLEACLETCPRPQNQWQPCVRNCADLCTPV